MSKTTYIDRCKSMIFFVVSNVMRNRKTWLSIIECIAMVVTVGFLLFGAAYLFFMSQPLSTGAW